MENTNYELQNNLQSLVTKQLGTDASRALAEQAKSSPEVADELAFSQSLALALRNRDMVAASLVIKGVIETEGLPPTEQTPTSTPGNRQWGLWLGSIALVLGLSVGGYFMAENQGWFLSTTERLAHDVAQPLENVLYLPQTGNGLADLQAGMAHYDAGRYAEAAEVLERYQSNQPDAAVGVYLGVARLLSGQPRTAIQPLADAANAVEPPVAEAANWYLALAYLANNQPNPAREALLRLPTDGIFAQQAALLLNKIPQ